MLSKRAFFAGAAALSTVGFSRAYGYAHVDKIPTQGFQFTGVSPKSVSGSAKFDVKGENIKLVFSKDFASDKGPDLLVLLHKSARPKSYNKDEYVSLGKLQSFRGTQGFNIGMPPAVLGQYKFVVVWCREFNVTFGFAVFQK